MKETQYAIIASEPMKSFAQDVYNTLDGQGLPVMYADVHTLRFSSGEQKPVIQQNVRGRDVFYFHDLHSPNPSTSFMDLLLTLDGLQRASARSINLVSPYMSYMRQDRKDEPRAPISTAVISNALDGYRKLEEIVTFDLHAPQIEAAHMHRTIEHIPGRIVLAPYVKTHFDVANAVIVSPDHGGEKRAEQFAIAVRGTNEIGVFSKRRSSQGVSKMVGYQGPDFAGKTVFVYDDMIDSGGSILDVSNYALEKGAAHVYAIATHGLFSQNAEERFAKSNVNVIVTNSIPRSTAYYDAHKSWLTAVSLEDTVATVITKMIQGESISEVTK